MYKVELKFKCEDLNALLNKDLHLPPYVYHLPEGLKTTDVKFPSKVGPWGICWVGTNGTQTQGSLILFPQASYTRKAIKSRMVCYYHANGFTHNEAKALSKIKVKNYHEKDLLVQIKQIESTDVFTAFSPYIYQDEPLTVLDLEKLRDSLTGLLEGRDDNKRLRNLVDIFRGLLCPKQP